MASGVGHFDSLGNPSLKFHLCGVIHKEPGLEFEGIIDTGFTGFIQLPLQHAFSLKLPLEGTASYTLADGNQTACLIALAKTTFAGKTVIGAVTLAPGSQDILVGMGFLRQFKLGIIMFKDKIILLDEEELDKIGQKQQTDERATAVAAAQPPQAPPADPATP